RPHPSGRGTGAGGVGPAPAGGGRGCARPERQDRRGGGREGRIEVVPTITALREDRRGRVAVELDGAPWRTVPVGVAGRAGLAEGRSLDRAALRTLRRELRRAEALAVAGRVLRSRDMSRAGLAARLQRAAVAPAAAD